MIGSKGPGQIHELGPYTLDAVIGSGGFGTVYRAVDPRGGYVALKVLTPHGGSDETVLRFEREGNIRIDHPNVVQVIDSGRDQGLFYIALELLEGKPLISLLEHAPLEPDAVIDLGLQVCAGLSAAHARGVVHRDLKPGNVFVQNDGVLKLLDFGIARPMGQAGPQLTLAGSVIGTPGYLSPEQAKGDPVITAAADLWSLGVILYQAASGTNPFMRSTAVATILAVVLEEPPPLGEEGRGLPRGLAEVIHRCLRKEPKERWASAEALAMALHGIDVEGSLVVGIPAGLGASIPPDEQRVVALLLASDVHDLDALDAAVREWGGELTPMLGGALGVFGGRTYEGDESSRAVNAALAARGAAAFIAVSSGRATGAGGTVSGDAVRAVERAVEARVAGVAVDAVAARGLAGHFDLRPLPGGAFEVPPSVPRLDSGSFLSVRDDLPLLDREAELAQLDSAIETAFDERRASVVWVGGPPGIGKSRLRAELERKLRAKGATVLASRAESHRRGTAFHALGAALRSEPSLEPFFLDPTISVERRRRVLEDFLAITLEDITWARQCLDPISRILGLPDKADPNDSGRRTDPQLMVDRVRVSLADLFGAMCARGPLAIVLDDAQWGDEATLTLLDELAGRLSRRAFLVMIAARSELGERLPELFATREVVRIAPRGLRDPDVATLANAIARRDVPDAIVRAVASRTGGNPFFVEQIVRELVEQNLIGSAVGTLPIPLDVEGAVQSRLDHLPAEEKQLLKRASVFSGGFTEAALAALEQPEPALHLGALLRRGLVSAHAASSGEREYRFKNALVAEVAYRMNPEESRRELHRLAAKFLAAVTTADREELGRHFELGGRANEAALAYADAAARAARRGDSESVLRTSERAIALGLSGAAAFDLQLARSDALSFLGRKEEQRDAIEAAIVLADTPERCARSLSEKAALLASSGDHEAALVVADEAVTTAREVADADVRASALARRGWVLLYMGRVQEAAQAIGEATSLLDRLAPETAAFVAAWDAQLASAMGDLGQRKIKLEESIARFVAIGDLRRAAAGENNLADTYNRVGAYQEAERALREAVTTCRRVGNRVVEGYSFANLGYALAGQGRLGEALAAFDSALALADRPRLELVVRLYRARATLELGDAAHVAAEARAIAKSLGESGLPAMRATALAVASRAALKSGDQKSALEDAEAAMALRDEIGAMEEDEAEVFVALTDALEASGQHERAKEIAVRGAGRLEFIAGRIADPDWRARFLGEVSVNRRLIELAARDG